MTDETATCRGCGKVLRGKPYWTGGRAFDPDTGKEAKKNHYGGFVCSSNCDYRAAMALERSMPGSDGYEGTWCMAYPYGALDEKWRDHGSR